MEDAITFVGCCGAYCKTCKPFVEGFCKGCKLGSAEGERDINKAKCVLKVCCFGERKLETCADCKDYPTCKKIRSFHDKSGYKYKKYKQSIEFIRENRYAKYIEIAEGWSGPYGKF